MAIDAFIRGAKNKKTVLVTDDQELCVISAAYPPFSEQKVEPFRQYLTDDGLISGSNDMGVDGSSNNIDFWIPADPSNDRYITALNWIVGYGTSGQPNQWANGAALTNGSRLFYDHHHEEIDLQYAIVTGKQSS